MGVTPLRRTTAWTQKPCDICGEPEQLRVLDCRTHEVRTRRNVFVMEFEDVVCENCGFVFAGRVPEDSFLEDYYSDAHTLRSDHVDIDESYDRDARLETVLEHVDQGGTVVEIGANTGSFCDDLRGQGFDAVGIDPLDDRSEDVADGFVGSIDSETSLARRDAVVSYYVLEHVTDANAWLAEVTDNLREGGTLIVEVPDFQRCPADSLNHEHLLHFTPAHLRALLESHGFSVVHVDTEHASRYFGMEAVGRLTGTSGPATEGLVPVDTAVGCYERGRRTLRKRREQRRDVAESIESILEEHDGATVYFWGANEYATGIVTELEGVDSRIVDSATSKIGKIHPGFDEPIESPEFERSADHHRIFVLCSPNWNDQILEQIEAQDLEDVTIVDGTQGALGGPGRPSDGMR